MNKNSAWYVGLARIELAAAERFVMKPGFSGYGDTDAKQREEDFIKNLQAHLRAWGGFTEEEIKTAIKFDGFRVFPNLNADPVEKDILKICENAIKSNHLSVKDISKFGSNLKEYFALKEEFYNEVLRITSSLKSEDLEQHKVIESNTVAFIAALKQKEISPDNLNAVLDKMATELKPHSSVEERIANSFCDQLTALFASQATPITSHDGDNKVLDGKASMLFNHFSSKEIPTISFIRNKFYVMCNGLKWKKAVVFSPRSGDESTSCRIQAQGDYNLSWTGIKDLNKMGRFSFDNPGTEKLFNDFLENAKPYIERYKQ